MYRKAHHKVALGFLARSHGHARRVIASTLRGHRLRLLEEDVRLATEYRDRMLKEVAHRIRDIDPHAQRSPMVNFDGDMTMQVQVQNCPGHHSMMLFKMTIPPDIFYQFAFGQERPELKETYSESELSVPPLAEGGTYQASADMLIQTMRKFVAEGGGAASVHTSLVPSP